MAEPIFIHGMIAGRQSNEDKIRRVKAQLAYLKFREDPNYNDVKFDSRSGGMKATHKDHNFAKVGGAYEKEVQEVGYKNGHAVILGAESSKLYGIKQTDGSWDFVPMEISGTKSGSVNNIKKKLSHCASKKADVAVLYFPNGTYSDSNFSRAMDMFNGLKKSNPKQYRAFKRVICIHNGKVLEKKPATP